MNKTDRKKANGWTSFYCSSFLTFVHSQDHCKDPIHTPSKCDKPQIKNLSPFNTEEKYILIARKGIVYLVKY